MTMICPRRRLTALASLALVLAVAAFAPGRADAQIISDLTTSQTSQSDINRVQAGQFTITPSSASVGSATLDLQVDGFYNGSTPPLSDFTAKIVNDSSGSPGSTTYATSTSASGTLGNSYSLITFNFGTPANLAAGNYWLELTATSAAQYALDWAANNGPLTNTGTDGIVTLNAYNGSSTSSGPGLLFSLSSPAAAVPEASQVTMMGLILAAGAGYAVHRRRRSRLAVLA
jgi:hypothetical protein